MRNLLFALLALPCRLLAADAAVGLVTPDYIELKHGLIREFPNAKPGRFGSSVPGVYERLDTDKKVLALTFDACGGDHVGYNAKLIAFLRKERIPATLFVTGSWIDANPKAFRELAADPLFDIANHGLRHRLCSVAGRRKFGVSATRGVGEVIDEMELNSRKIARLTGRRPFYFRSATVFMDETAVRIARRLGMKTVGYGALSGDSVPKASAKTLKENLLSRAKPGAIVIMHFNHPEWNEEEALRLAVPLLRAKGYSFVKLRGSKLREAR